MGRYRPSVVNGTGSWSIRYRGEFGRGSVENRVQNRARKRVMVRYGVGHPEKTGFTKNISPTGVYIKTNAVFAPGTMLQMEIELGTRKISMWGQVVWAKRVPPQLAHVLDCGMGVRFVDPGPEWTEHYPHWESGEG